MLVSSTTTMRLSSSLFKIPIINNILFYDTIGSTNDKAKELARRNSVHGSLVVAKSQTAGKGRLGRRFYSTSDDGLYFSLLLRPNVEPSHLSGITLVAALALSEAIDEYCKVKTTIKWPNDIYLNGKKILGILTEAGPDYVVLGIGINVNTPTFNSNIANTASSLFLETGLIYDKAELLNIILCKLNSLYESFVSHKDLSFMQAEYNSSLAGLNKEVYIIPQNVTLNIANPSDIDLSNLDPYICLGIDITGNLKCQDSFGIIHYVNSGEVSLRTK